MLGEDQCIGVRAGRNRLSNKRATWVFTVLGDSPSCPAISFVRSKLAGAGFSAKEPAAHPDSKSHECRRGQRDVDRARVRAGPDLVLEPRPAGLATAGTVRALPR
jgi:hypothetical protein